MFVYCWLSLFDLSLFSSLLPLLRFPAAAIRGSEEGPVVAYEDLCLNVETLTTIICKLPGCVCQQWSYVNVELQLRERLQALLSLMAVKDSEEAPVVAYVDDVRVLGLLE